MRGICPIWREIPASPAGGFAGEYGGQISNPYQPGIDYGNVNFTRRNRFLTTFLYDLPFGKGKMLLNGANGLVDRVVGGWELAGVLLFQSGPFMTVSQLNDPCGCGFNVFSSTGGRADTVSGVSPYAGQSIGQWINPAAFVSPAERHRPLRRLRGGLCCGARHGGGIHVSH